MRETTFKISQTFRSETEQARKEKIQEIIDRYLKNKLENS